MRASPSTAVTTTRSWSWTPSSKPPRANAPRLRKPGWNSLNASPTADPGVPLRPTRGCARIAMNSDSTMETDTMAHNPVNHPLRPLYRTLGTLAGLYLVVFGVVGIIVNAGEDFFAVHGERVLGQDANMFWSIVALIIGAVIVVASVIGRNLDTAADKYLGWALLVIGTYGLATCRTDANFFGFSIATVIVTYLVGLVLIMAGMYV